MTTTARTPRKPAASSVESEEIDRLRALIVDLQGDRTVLTEEKDDLLVERNRWRDRNSIDAEAACIENCARALTILVDNSTGTTWGATNRSVAQVERILRYLAARYGVDLTPPRKDGQSLVTVPPGAREGDRIVVDYESGDAWRAP